MQNAFEYADSIAKDAQDDASSAADLSEEVATHRARANSVDESPKQPYLNLATFRMVVLADELLEAFFEIDLTKSWKLETPVIETPIKSGFLGGLFQAIATDENKVCLLAVELLSALICIQERFNRLADAVGQTLEIQTIEQKPSIGKTDALSSSNELKSRESMFSPRMAPSPSQSSPSMRSPSMRYYPFHP